jgi:MoxR-like ATPase
MKNPKFEPKNVTSAHRGEHLGDGAVYLYWDPKIVLAVNIALATERPLLVRGEPGTGKSSLARNLSVQLRREFEPVVVTSRTTVTDLLWEVDLVERLAKAQTGRPVEDLREFVHPRAYWRAFTRRGPKELGGTPTPNEADKGAVLLIDEIDKADPDLPNALLEPMANRRFSVSVLNEEISCERPAPLVIFTTNGYRRLSRPFLRRCIELELKRPDLEDFVKIAARHFESGNPTLHRRLAEALYASDSGSVAEYLDAIRACEELGIGPDDSEFGWLLEATVQKTGGKV